MSVDFVAIDVETANASLASICQIGIASYGAGRLIDEWKSYVNPEDYFDGINVSIHGIDEDTVSNAPTLPQLAGDIYRFLDGRVAVCHTHFDRTATHQAFAKHGLRPPSCQWLDSARVTRRAWEQFAFSGYGLGNVCKWLGHKFEAHDALEDAKAAATVLHAAIQQTGIGVTEWLQRVERPVLATAGGTITREGNPDGVLFGEVMVFTGALVIPRVEAADLSARMGCRVEANVTKRTTILVVGDQDIARLAGHEKSRKHRKAEELIAIGQPIRIIGESDFRSLAEQEVGVSLPTPAAEPAARFETSRTNDGSLKGREELCITISIADLEPALSELNDKLLAMSEAQREEFHARWEADLDAEEAAEMAEEAAEDARALDLFDFHCALRDLPRGQVPSSDHLGRVHEYLMTQEIGPALMAARAFSNAQQFDRAEALLLQACDCEERRAVDLECGVRTTVYEALAKLYRRTKRYDEEVRILERFLGRRRRSDAATRALAERIAKARSLLAAK